MTESGTTADYMLAPEGDRILFAGRAPAHAAGAIGARKVLVLRLGGDDEALEIHGHGEPFWIYSAVELRATEVSRG